MSKGRASITDNFGDVDDIGSAMDMKMNKNLKKLPNQARHQREINRMFN